MRTPSAGALPAAVHVVLLLFFLSNGPAAAAQSGASDRGFIFSETFQGSTHAIATVTKLNTMAGYRFNHHFEMDAGVPVYFVRPSSDTAALGATSGNGLGNIYLTLRLSASNSTATYISSLKAAAPTGDSARGFSTGRVTVDWNNYIGFNAGRLTPFANLGLANSISDTQFFTRPFSSLGKVAHFEGGSAIQVWRHASFGASAYLDAPFGGQKVYSQVVARGQLNQSSAGPGMGMGRGRKPGAFETQSVTIGGPDILRDSGGSIWLDVYPARIVNFEIGYSRSINYDLNSLFFSISLNLGEWIRTTH